MPVLQGFALLLLCQVAGEALSQALPLIQGGVPGLRLPGPVLGLLLMLVLLALPPFARRFGDRVGAASDALLAHLSLLFVPIGVGVIAHLGVLGEHAAAIAAVLVLSAWVGLAAAALVLGALWRDDAPAPGAGGGGAR
jgi:holin-like protein